MVLESEFRIGNWYDQFGVYHQVNWVVMKELSRAPKTQLWCKPIPLTPEMLEKAGFECYGVYPDGFSSYIKKGVEVHLPYFEFCYSDSDYKTEIKHLHQLQNLYFALTGEELQIDL